MSRPAFAGSPRCPSSRSSRPTDLAFCVRALSKPVDVGVARGRPRWWGRRRCPASPCRPRAVPALWKGRLAGQCTPRCAPGAGRRRLAARAGAEQPLHGVPRGGVRLVAPGRVLDAHNVPQGPVAEEGVDRLCPRTCGHRPVPSAWEPQTSRDDPTKRGAREDPGVSVRGSPAAPTDLSVATDSGGRRDERGAHFSSWIDRRLAETSSGILTGVMSMPWSGMMEATRWRTLMRHKERCAKLVLY